MELVDPASMQDLGPEYCEAMRSSKQGWHTPLPSIPEATEVAAAAPAAAAPAEEAAPQLEEKTAASPAEEAARRSRSHKQGREDNMLDRGKTERDGDKTKMEKEKGRESRRGEGEGGIEGEREIERETCLYIYT